MSEFRIEEIDQEIEKVMKNPATSYWLRNTLSTALKRDPVKLASEAEVLAALLGKRADVIVKRDIEQAQENDTLTRDGRSYGHGD